MKTHQKHTNYKPLIITIVIIVLVAISAGVALAWNASQDKQQLDNIETPGINYSPPTEEEVEKSQDGKKNGQEDPEANEALRSDKKVSVGVAFAGYDPDEKVVDIRAFTPDVIEGDGTCTATLTKDDNKVIKKTKAFIDSSSSQCQPILIPETDFPATGVWQLVVEYSSPHSSGSSPSMPVEVVK